MTLADEAPTLADIRAAASRIASLVRRTPVLTSRSLSGMCGAEVFFKCESFQRTGSFKIRGAGNAILRLPDEVLSRGVVTHSSGNHAAAVACAASHRGARSYIVVPNNTPLAKREAAAGFGGEIHLCEPTLAARQAAVDEIQRQTGAVLVHPYDDPMVIAGQGTAAMELLEEVPDLEVIAAPVSGGGLLSGTAIAARSVRPGIHVFGAEPEKADDARRSFTAGSLQPLLSADTVADGLRAALCPRTFAIIQAHAEDLLTVSEEQILQATKLLWQYLKVVVEPSGAVPFAMLLAHPSRFAGRRVGLILSGGNLDLDRLPWQP
jgi:threonine dehydratase